MSARSNVIAAALLLLPSLLFAQTKPPAADRWEPLRYFVGKWQGVGIGQSGTSKIDREYRFVLNDRFLQVQSRSVYESQPKNPKGEVHEEWGFISFDENRKQFVVRQFHVEGFVIQYVAANISGNAKEIILTSESIENIPTGWRARETYKIISADEFVEVFELAAPEKDFQEYVENRFQRKK